MQNYEEIYLSKVGLGKVYLNEMLSITSILQYFFMYQNVVAGLMSSTSLSLPRLIVIP